MQRPDNLTVVKISEPADIVGVLPHRLGFHPRESLVVVCLEGSRRRDMLVMRFDLPAPAEDQSLAVNVVARVRHVGATAAVLVCYSDASAPATGLLRAELIAAARKRLALHRIEVVEALLVREGRWWSYSCGDVSCCPAAGTPVRERLSAAAGAYAAETVARGHAVLPTREDLVRSIEPSDDALSVAGRAAARETAADRLVPVLARGGVEAVGEVAVATLRRLAQERAKGNVEVSAEDAAVVGVGLRHRVARDMAATLVLDHSEEVFVAVLTEIARRLDDVDAAPVCSVLAWATYSCGGGALALVAAERAVRCEPGYLLAELVLDAIDRMVAPSTIRTMTAAVRSDLTG